MLILTRRPGERVVIGDEILVTVMGISGHTVRLGIAAPAGVPIYREEIWLAVREENRAAAAADAGSLPPAPGDAPATPAPAPGDTPTPPTAPTPGDVPAPARASTPAPAEQPPPTS
jgi:carbon storage regulator